MARRTYKQPEFERLLQDKESDELEFKTAAGGFPKSFWSTYSSFANTNGGAIVFGVKEDGDNLILDELDETQIAKYKKDFFNGMHSKQNDSWDVQLRGRIEVIALSSVGGIGRVNSSQFRNPSQDGV